MSLAFNIFMNTPSPTACTSTHKLATTPNLILGPFYPLNPTVDAGADLFLGGAKAVANVAHSLILSGQVLNRTGQAVTNALVDIWHADGDGRYPHPSASPTGPIDLRFIGYGAVRTDADGHYQFRTLQPAAYVENGLQRAPHIHFQVTGQHDRLITQMFFPDEPLRDSDHWFRAVTRPLQLVALQVSEGNAPLRLQWDIVLRNG